MQLGRASSWTPRPEFGIITIKAPSISCAELRETSLVSEQGGLHAEARSLDGTGQFDRFPESHLQTLGTCSFAPSGQG